VASMDDLSFEETIWYLTSLYMNKSDSEEEVWETIKRLFEYRCPFCGERAFHKIIRKGGEWECQK